MKRSYVGVLSLCLAFTGGCASQRPQGNTKTANAIQEGNVRIDQAERMDAAEAEKHGLPPPRDETDGQPQMQSSGKRAEAFDEAEAEKQGEYNLTAHRHGDQTGGVVSVTVLDTGLANSSTEAPSYGNPPGAYTAPGTTRSVRPTQGALRNTATPKGTDVREARDQRPLARQGESESDRLTTQRIRRALLDDDSLSYASKNVQIATRDGNVTLSGVVATEEERWQVERKARAYAGSGTVDNLLALQHAPAPPSSASSSY